MRAMVLLHQKEPLQLQEIAKPEPNENQVLIKVSACGICRTDLHVVDGDLTEPVLPLIPGHQIIGTVVKTGSNVKSFSSGDKIGVPWLGGSCGHCSFCVSGQENLCDESQYTGYQINGGFAEYTVANEQFCFPVPEQYPDIQAAPLLCAGLIGYRSYKKTGDANRLGLYGFGAAAHILIQVAKYHQQEVFVFTRKGDTESQKFAERLGADWVGASGDVPQKKLDAAIIFAPVGELVIDALKTIRKGGIVVCAGIHMSDIPSFPYALIWGERTVTSVANLTRKDGLEFLSLAPEVPVRTEVTSYPLERTNDALDDLRNGRFNGAAVIKIS